MNGYMQDYCDGRNFQRHALFSLKKDSLQLLFYYDDVEVCNPLGSKRTIHKLGITCLIVIRTILQLLYICVHHMHVYRAILLHPWESFTKVQITSELYPVSSSCGEQVHQEIWNERGAGAICEGCV